MALRLVEGTERVVSGRRRRVRAGRPRRRQVVVRFSDAELDLVGETAALAGLTVGAWIGATIVEVAHAGGLVAVGLPDLLRLHTDVLVIERAAAQVGADGSDVVALLARLDAAVDEVVAEVRRARS